MVTKNTGVVTVEDEGQVQRMRVTSAQDVTDAVARLGSRSEVTLTIELDNTDERLMIAVDNSLAFLGLERSDGIFQFATATENAGQRDLVIGGRTTSIDRRFLVAVSIAATVAGEWFERTEYSSSGWWERQ